MLYLVATPIGNLGDISYRAIQVLKNCDYILCEDTRHSRILLNHYEINKPLISYHKFNEKRREDEIIDDLKAGREIALISDAGTPGICDPGEMLVKRCREEGLNVTGIPGACAWVLALALSRMDRTRFQFVGFLPRSFDALLRFEGTTICYESPHRIVRTLKKIEKNRKVCVMREMTKTYEECLEGTAESLVEHFEKNPPRGEFVLLIEGHQADFSGMSPEEHVKALEKEYGVSKKEAVEIAAKLRKVSKREVYKSALIAK